MHGHEIAGECVAAFGAGLSIHLLWDAALIGIGLLFGWKVRRRRCNHGG